VKPDNVVMIVLTTMFDPAGVASAGWIFLGAGRSGLI
jgi:hypothetical protein